MTYELKPCPFCGGDVLNVTKDSFYHILQCDQCGVEKAHTRKHKLIKGWNRRANLARPKVKPLEWDDWSEPHKYWYYSETSFGRYSIRQAFFPESCFIAVTPTELRISENTLEAAKAAAQADYEHRIIAALEGE